MKPFWHALSMLWLPDLQVPATVEGMRLLGRGRRPFALVHFGDRMLPGVGHGQQLRATAPEAGAVSRGRVVVAAPYGIPELWRVVSRAEDGGLRLRADADPGSLSAAAEADVLASLQLPPRRRTAAACWMRAIGRDHREALSRRVDLDRAAAAESVRAKYDSQAPYYASLASAGVEPALLEALRPRAGSGARALVAGCGSGGECIALAETGFEVVGIDFSAAMVEAARRAVAERAPAVRIVHGELLSHEEPPGSLALVYFTYDVYSFLADPRGRTALLRRMRSWLREDGRLLLSARRVRRPYQAWILSLQWLGRLLRGRPRPWGHSHTRYLAPDGSPRRSFVQYFTARGLRREIESAGLVVDHGTGGHLVLRPGPERH